ncbi:MAG: homocysteine S-methyltransferase family protein [Deltaproteobacteria bacterium]|jgi:5-methyltetrahydrofolate--homocysteine methyltransferase|nr:homocysteine S-methyltransferase family protein [Deltaproteobacteria bacterium]
MNGNLFLNLVKDRIVFFDGAMGTMLLEAGLPPGGVPELWNLEKPDVVMGIYQQYFNAGADVVHTNTFGGSAPKLGIKGHAGQMEAINLAAVKLARRVCPENSFVAGDMGPTGKMLEPMGDATFETLEEAFFLQASALINGGADIISIETMFSLEEATAALKGAKRAGSIPVIAGITYNKTPNGFFTMMGETVEQCAATLAENGADAVACNCTLGSSDIIDLTRELRKATTRPILIQPNAGKPVPKDDITVYEQTPAEFAGDIKRVIDEGADMVGGCCGTNAALIKEVVRTIGKKLR